MAVHFPNPSRSYNAASHAIRFWGYDSSIERSFVITAGALNVLRPGVAMDEKSLLAVFDAFRSRICDAAAKLYSRSPGNYCEVGQSDV
jgi:hypothetical protein